MSYSALKEALEKLDELIGRSDVPDDAKTVMVQVKRDLYALLDELIWTKSKLFEAFRSLEELAGALGVAGAVQRGNGKMYVEAAFVYRPDGTKVRVEKTI